MIKRNNELMQAVIREISNKNRYLFIAAKRLKLETNYVNCSHTGTDPEPHNYQHCAATCTGIVSTLHRYHT